MIKHSEEYKREAVRIALTSGLPRERAASDLGVGKSTRLSPMAHASDQPTCANGYVNAGSYPGAV